MLAEFDIYGVYVPSFLVLMLAAYAVNRALRGVIGRTGFYALVWHRALFDLALYVLVLGAACLLFKRFI